MLRLLIVCSFALAHTARAELKFEQPVQEFHRRPADAHVQASFAFKNIGSAPATIRRIVTSCGCTSAKLDKKIYAPGESGEIEVKFTFGKRRGPQRKIISVTTDDKAQTMLDLRVWIQEPLTVSPALVFWKVGEPAEAKSVSLTIAAEQKMRITGVTSSNERMAAKLVTLKPGEKYAVQVQPTDTSRKETAELTVQTDFPPDAPKSYTVHARVK